MGLRARLALLLGAAVAMLLVVGGLLLTSQLRSGVDAALDASLKVRADALAQQVSPDGSVANFQDGGSGSSIAAEPALAQVIGPAGQVTEASQAAGSTPLLDAAQLTSARRHQVTLTVDRRGESLRLLAAPVTGARSSAVVVVGASREVATAALERVQVALWVGGPVLVLAAAAGAWLVVGAALRPVERMRSRAEEISAHDTTARLPVPARDDEIARLGRTLNGVLAKLQHALDQQRRLVADASHELRTPLATLRAELELAGRPHHTREEMSAALTEALRDVDRLTALAEGLLVLARSDSGALELHREPVPLAELATSAAAGARLSLDRSVQVVTELEPVMACVDPVRIRQVLDNLLDNAVRAAPREGTVTVGLHRDGATGAVRLTVSDDGPGFPPEFLEQAFQRFTRADPARSGAHGAAGLGLAIVDEVVRAHGGSVTARNRPAGGAEVDITLPVEALPGADM